MNWDGGAAIKAYDNYFYFAFGDRSKILTLRPDKNNFRLQCITEKDCNDASDKICCAKIQLKDSKTGGGLTMNRCLTKEHDNGKVTQAGGSITKLGQDDRYTATTECLVDPNDLKPKKGSTSSLGFQAASFVKVSGIVGAAASMLISL